jgi:hypothetical protein
MVLKEFSITVPDKGQVNVSFYLHFDTHTVTIDQLKICADYDCGLPHQAKLVFESGTWRLYADHPVMDHNNVVVAPIYFDDEVSREIVERVQAMREQEMP